MKRPAPPTAHVAAVMQASDSYARPKSYAVGLRGALQQGQPGAWASDHRAESERFTGWHYISIHTLALQASKAAVFVFDDSRLSARDKTVLRERRKSYRGTIGLAKAVELGKVGEPLPPDHPLVRLQSRPSPTQSGASFRYEQIQQLELTGNCYIWNVPNRLGNRTVERYVIPTAVLTPKEPAPGMPSGGYYVNPSLSSRYTRVVDSDGFVETSGWRRAVGSVIPAEQMQTVRWPHPLLKDDGYSPMGAGAQWTDTSEMIDKARWGHLKRGPDPSVGMTLHPDCEIESEADLDRLAAKINAKYGGADKAGEVFIAAGVQKIEPLTTAPKDMAYADGFIQLRDAILALRGVTPIAAGLIDGGSYAAFYAAMRGFVQLSVMPRLSLLAEEDTEQLAKQYGEGITIEIEPAGIDDPTLLQTQIQTAGGALLKDEVRDMLFGMTPMPGGKGQEPMGTAEPQAQAFGVPGAEETGVRNQPNYFGEDEGKTLSYWFNRTARMSLNGNGNGKH